MDAESDTSRTPEAYTITEMSGLLGESRTKIYRWIEGFEHGERFKASGIEDSGGTHYDRTQWEDLLASVGREVPSQEELEEPEQEVHTSTIRFSGLLKPGKTSSLDVSVFDINDYVENKQILEEQTSARAQELNASVIRYAQARMAQTLADIDITAAQIRDNAFKSMGLNGNSTGDSPQGGEDA